MEPDGDEDGEFEGSSTSTSPEPPIQERTPSPLTDPDQTPVYEVSGAAGADQPGSSNEKEKQSPPQPMIAVSGYTSVEDMLENLKVDGISLTDAQYQSVIGAMAPGNERYKLLQQKDGETRWPTQKEHTFEELDNKRIQIIYWTRSIRTLVARR